MVWRYRRRLAAGHGAVADGRRPPRRIPQPRRNRGETGGIAGWDYSRALSLLSSGYLSKEDALNRSLDIARRVQKEFDSWDNFMASYFTGYEYWSDDEGGQRQRVYMALKGKPDSLYKLPWQLELKRAW